MKPSLTRFMSWDPPPTAQAFADIWREWLKRIDDKTDFHLVVRSKNGEFLGLAGLHRDNAAEPELGIWIKEAAHGHGYGREAMIAVVAWASRRFSPRAFIYPVAEANSASRRIAEALNGVVRESRSRSKFEEIVYLVPIAR